MEVKSAVSGGGPPVEPMGCPCWSRPTPLPAVQPATTAAASEAISALDPTHDISWLTRIDIAVSAQRAFPGFVPQALVAHVTSSTDPGSNGLVFSVTVNTSGSVALALNPLCRPRNSPPVYTCPMD